jgi:hypothetical protein
MALHNSTASLPMLIGNMLIQAIFVTARTAATAQTMAT